MKFMIPREIDTWTPRDFNVYFEWPLIPTTWNLVLYVQHGIWGLCYMDESTQLCVLR